MFLSYLISLLPPDPVGMVDLEGKLKLEYYKLQKTYEGTIELEEEKGVYEPATARGAIMPEEKVPLDEIIEKINELYRGPFTDGDRVLLTALFEDRAKYNAIMHALGAILYREMRGRG